MKRLIVLALIVLALAATSEAQMRDFTIQYPIAGEAKMLEAIAAHHQMAWPTTLADSSSAVLTYGLTVCVPASADDVAAGVCTVRDTTLPERRTLLRRWLRGLLREQHLAYIGSTDGEAARAATVAAAAAGIPVEQ